MTSYLETLASYVPPFVIRRFVSLQREPNQPQKEVFEATVLFADISGFTQLTETLSQRGAAGTESLSDLLNAYFGQLIDLITQHGGEVAKFAGDALLALWPVEEAGLATAVALASQCALAIQTQVSQPPIATANPLLLRLGVSAGSITNLYLGGVFNRWEMLVAGEPLVEVNKAQKQAQPGQVVLDAKAWSLVQNRCVGLSLPDEQQILVTIHTPCPLPNHQPLSLNPELSEFLKPYIPGAIRGRLEAGQLSWLAELRRLTVLFVNLPALTHEVDLMEAQAMMQSLQKAIYRYEGSVNKLSVDDKGATLVVIMGLPPFSHEDDALRGVQTALALQEEMERAGWAFTIGITTGRAFCGSIGNDTRREYTILGDVVNVSARLMQTAVTLHTPVLCDQTTYEATQSHLTYRLLPPVMVKGKSEPVAIYHPVRVAKEQMRHQSRIVGRVGERLLIQESLQAVQAGTNQLLIFEGEAGIGKSKLASEAIALAQHEKMNVLVGAGDAIDKSTPYHAWRPIFAQLFGLDLLNDSPAEQRERVLARLAADFTDLLTLSPLLNVVLPLDLPDNELTKQMSGEVHRVNTHVLLTGLLRGTAVTLPILIVLEDAHWLDSASWSLAQIAYRDVQPLFLVLATRPLSEPVPAEYRLLQAQSQAQGHFVPLTILAADQIEALVCYRLGVNHLPAVVARFIHQKAEGHPFFSEELAYALRDSGFLQVVNGECRLTEQAGDLSHLNFPDTIQGIVTSRIDRLAPQQVLALKVASVIGRVFAYRVLRDIYPITEDKPHLSDYLNHLQSLDITPLESPEPDLAYIFKHIITQEVAYNLMSFAQRQQLHHTIAQWYEQIHGQDLSPYFPILAYHWQAAKMASKAVVYLAKAGDQALRNHANQEAVRFFSEALRLVAEATPSQTVVFSPLTKAHWHRQLGAAYYELGQLSASRENLMEAAALLGQLPPTSKGEIVWRLFQQVGRQFLYRLGMKPPALGDEAEQVLELSRSAASLGEVLYYTGETSLGLVYSTLSLNLAERLGPSPDLASCYANISIGASIVPLHGLARLYGRLAQEVAAKDGGLIAWAHVAICVAVYHLGIGDWPESERLLNQTAEIAQKINDPRQWISSRTSLAVQYYFQGRFAESIQLNQLAYEAAVRTGNTVQQGWGLYAQAESYICLGELETALAILVQSEALVVGETRRPSQIRVYGTWAVVKLRQGHFAEALELADKTAVLMAQITPNSYSGLATYSNTSEVYLTLWEKAETSAEREAMRQKALQVLPMVRGYARLFAVGQARACYYEGWHAWLENQPAKAHRWWQKGVIMARQIQMPYEEKRLWEMISLRESRPH